MAEMKKKAPIQDAENEANQPEDAPMTAEQMAEYIETLEAALNQARRTAEAAQASETALRAANVEQHRETEALIETLRKENTTCARQPRTN